MKQKSKKLPSKEINKILDEIMEENTKKNGATDTLKVLNSLRYIAILRYLDKQKI